MIAKQAEDAYNELVFYFDMESEDRKVTGSLSARALDCAGNAMVG
ncbi:hypothetical protein [Paenibacillus lacisoli]|nr:hypothetical protein [Paenibacillus sp. JX-17]